jgi:hypothetical protein
MIESNTVDHMSWTKLKPLVILLAVLGTVVARTEGYIGSSQQRKNATDLDLAKTGDRQALQYFACQSMTANVLEMEPLMRTDLDQIGGDFAVEVYRQLLDSDQRFIPQIKKLRKNPAEDALPRLPSITVLYHLPILLPEAEISDSKLLDLLNHEVDPDQDFGLRGKWRAWIDTHKTEVQKLKPSTTGITFDLGYCSKFKDASQH